MNIVTVPHPALRAKCQPVLTVDKKFVTFIEGLQTTLAHKKNPQGVGLSAPQVNSPWRVFCTFLDMGKGEPEVRTYINPKVVRASQGMTLGPNPQKPILEGCLSIPGLWGPVWRHQWIKLSYFVLKRHNINPGIDSDTYQLTKVQKRFSSFPARVIQHELDHLDGILFTDHAFKSNLPVYLEKKGQLEEIDKPTLTY